MNENLQNALTELLNKANQGIDSGTDIIMAELPDVIQQLLIWYGLYNFLMFCLGLVILCCVVVFNKFLIKKIVDEDDEKYFHFCILGLCNFFASLMYLIPINLVWLKIWIAPKIWLIEYAANLAK